MLPGTTEEALARVDLARNQLGLAISTGIALTVAAVIQVVPTKSTLHWMATAALLSAAFLCVLLRYANARRQRTGTGEQIVLGMVLCFVALVVLGYVGPFSAGVVVLALLVFCHGFSHDNIAGLVVYVGTAAGYLALTVASLAGLIVARATPIATITSNRGYVLLSMLVQLTLLAVYVIARNNRIMLTRALGEAVEAHHKLRKNEVELVRARSHSLSDEGVFGKLSGLNLGRYRLGEVIGRGGMGEVYRAICDDTQEPAAVKVLAESMREDPVQIERFFREAQVCGELHSPHIVAIHDAAWSDDGRYPFLAMELLEGHDLGSYLRARGPLPLRDVVDLVQDVARALTCAHAIGIVHRDMKPENVFFAEDEEGARWKVLDFGISKMRFSGGTLTKNGVIGTPNYMSPEQAQGGGVDARSDVFALGAIVYRVLTGRLAFDAQEPLAALLQVMNEQPVDPMDLCSLPPDVELALAVGLAKDKTKRFSTAQAFADAFTAAARSALPEELRRQGRELLDERPWAASDAICTKSPDRLGRLTPPSPLQMSLLPPARSSDPSWTAEAGTAAFPDFAELLAGEPTPLPARGVEVTVAPPSPPPPRSSYTRQRGGFVEDDTLPLEDVLGSRSR